MLTRFLLFAILILLFFLLSKAADFSIDGIRTLGKRLRVRALYLGFFLGFLTSLPELFLGINAVIKDVGEISFGNLTGGIIVLLGFIMGLNIILHRQVRIVDGVKLPFLLLMGGFLLLPFIFILDGKISLIESFFIMIAYVSLIMYWLRKKTGKRHEVNDREIKIRTAIIYFIVGIAGIIVLSRLIIDVTIILLTNLNVSKLMVGVIVFSVGTNLPEFMVVLESWKKRIKNIGLGNLLGSAMTHIFILGALSSVKQFEIGITANFLYFFAFSAVTIILFVIFARTERKLRLWEGAALILIYIFFIISQLLLTNA